MGQVHSSSSSIGDAAGVGLCGGCEDSEGSRQKCLGRDLKELGSGTDVSGSPAATEKPAD